MSKVISLWGGATGERIRDQKAVDALKDALEKAEAGEVIGVSIAMLHADGLASYANAGMVGGYSIIGAATMAIDALKDVVRE